VARSFRVGEWVVTFYSSYDDRLETVKVRGVRNEA